MSNIYKVVGFFSNTNVCLGGTCNCRRVHVSFTLHELFKNYSTEKNEMSRNDKDKKGKLQYALLFFSSPLNSSKKVFAPFPPHVR